ncbi:lantibiotic dehydratase [Niabella sp. CC-SYL272]|uniref:lantibiotic dehydratase n=1 Tax=Niabella agricola TaxID=2891571 RepID=UPI001F1700BF|nr:lantibiotic dehydratase [Niabella agricola]MCF3109613.1 lantibiotic dehydratase [Niabella agricola]
MTRLTINDKVILRLPRFSYREDLNSRWEDLKEMIRDASPDFYEVIKALTYQQLQRTDRKIQATVRKYFNRACYRATPYAQFATVGMTTLDSTTNDIVVPAEPRIHRFSDWSDLPNEIPQLEKVQTANALLFANTTFYELLHEIRFVQKTAQDFQLVAIDHDPIITAILQHCNIPIPFKELQERVKDLISSEELEAYTEHLLNLQLLISSLHPNIIGEDYFTRSAETAISNKSYLVAERSATVGSIDKKLLRHLPELVNVLQKVLPDSQPDALKSFKTQFLKRFEEAEVPLMMVLDAEAGIGYGSLELYDGDKLLEPFLTGDRETPSTQQRTQLQARLCKAMLEHGQNQGAIDLEQLAASEPADKLPNSFSAGVTIADDLLLIDYLGGATAISIAGRFAFGVKPLADFCREIAQFEQAANPDVLLFDVGYTKETGVDNINRRPSIYELQLNILNYDTSSAPIGVNDLVVSIRNNEVVLRSLRLSKRMVPRMTTTYNYMRSNLSLFRFLLDVQNQGLRTEMLFRPSGLLPGLNHYPRIQFKNIIVSPASWRLDKKAIKPGTSPDRVQSLKAHLKGRIPGRYLRTGFADQTLLLDVEKEENILLLLGMLEKSDSLYVDEALLPRNPIVKTPDGRPFLPQFIFTLQHDSVVARPIPAGEVDTVAARKVCIAPGADWLYYQIFCNPHRAEALLNEKINSFLENNRSALEKWFFIRYNEGGDHIRLRMQLKDTSLGHALTGELTALLQPELDNGIIRDIKLGTYHKETARYSLEMMERVEVHFYRDSEFVLAMLQAMLTANARYRLCADILQEIRDSDILTEQQINSFLQTMSDAYNQEHKITNIHFKELNRRYKEFQKETTPPLNLKSHALHEHLKISFTDILRHCPEERRQKLLADLLHMHVNRLFATHQRMHEMVLYNFLMLEHKSRKHRHKAEVS